MSASVSKQTQRRIPLGLERIRSRLPGMQTIDEIFFFFLFLAFSIPFRFPLGSFTIGLAEPFTFVFILLRFWIIKAQREDLTARTRFLVAGFWMFAGWLGFLWVLANNWKDRREALLGWVLAAALITVLLRKPPKDWRRIAILFVVAALPNMIVGILQHFLGIGMTPKDFSGWAWNASVTTIPVIGFFGHSNDFAVYLFLPLVLSLGLALERIKGQRVLFGLLAIFFALILYWTVSRTVMVTAAGVILCFLLIVLIRKRRIFAWSILGGLGLSVISLLLILQTQSAAVVNYFLSGRPELWRQALAPIFADPWLLPVGYLAVPTADLNIFWLPHNIYIYAWLNYGIIGFFFLLSLSGFILFTFWKQYDLLRSLPLAAFLWIGMIGLLLLNGLASLYLHENYILLTFTSILAIGIGLLHDQQQTKILTPPNRSFNQP